MVAKKVLIVCGEASGDLHAASLAKALLRQEPGCSITAVGGPLLAQAGARVIYDIKGLAVIGLFDALKKLPRFFALRRLLLDTIDSSKPDALVLVDFSGFNLRLARALKKRIPVIYYVSPQVWASRPGRVRTIRDYVSKMIVLFAFERDFYARYGIAADFVGHPLLDTFAPCKDKASLREALGLERSQKTIALLPGSRRQEIINILAVMLAACRIIRKTLPDSQFIIAKSAHVDKSVYQDIMERSGMRALISEAGAFECLSAADFSLVCSGTATLEAAAAGNPFAVLYRMGLLNYLLYRPQVRLPYIGMVNIVAGKKIVEEFVQFGCSAARVAACALATLNDPAKDLRIRKDLSTVVSVLGTPGASERAAGIILEFINR